MKNLITILLVIIGILSWNSSSFKNEASMYEMCCAGLFVFDVIAFALWMGLSQDDM